MGDHLAVLNAKVLVRIAENGAEGLQVEIASAQLGIHPVANAPCQLYDALSVEATANATKLLPDDFVDLTIWRFRIPSSIGDFPQEPTQSAAQREKLPLRPEVM